jgi:dTDP-4-amino-4,6-dideoxygalactose transaminase
MKLIPYGRQDINSEDIASVVKALKKDLITTGDYSEKFEKEIIKVTKSKYASVCSSGTAAIHLSLIAINLERNDIVIMPAINFISSYNICKILNAKVYLADVDPRTGQMTPKTLIDCIYSNNIKKIKVVITMYLSGSPNNVFSFYKLKKKFNFYLIEDACHAFGAKYFHNNSFLNVGSCKHSDICTFSFHPVKTITTGEGGVVTTNDYKLHKKINILRSHGISRDKIRPWSYDIKFSGFNYRLSDINCALGLSQLKRLRLFLSKRRKIAKFYINFLKHYSRYITITNVEKNIISAWHLFIVHINFSKLKITKDVFLKNLRYKNIFFQQHYIPIYKFKVYNGRKIKMQGAEKYFKNAVSMPIFFSYKLSSAKQVLKNMLSVLKINNKYI